jgi:hypothetical protein
MPNRHRSVSERPLEAMEDEAQSGKPARIGECRTGRTSSVAGAELNSAAGAPRR